jgi:hypothetical protein
MTPTITIPATTPGPEPLYYRYVADGAIVTVWTGEHVATNSYYGASRIYRAATTTLGLRRGAELHVLHIGAYVVQDGVAYKLIFTDPESSPFERNTQRPLRFEAWQLASMSAVEATAPVAGYPR